MWKESQNNIKIFSIDSKKVKTLIISGFLTNELRVTIYCMSYELLFTYELRVAIYCTSCDLLFI